MRKIIKRLVTLLVWIVSKLYPYSFKQRLRDIHNELYTMWICNFIGRFGQRSRILVAFLGMDVNGFLSEVILLFRAIVFLHVGKSMEINYSLHQ